MALSFTLFIPGKPHGQYLFNAAPNFDKVNVLYPKNNNLRVKYLLMWFIELVSRPDGLLMSHWKYQWILFDNVVKLCHIFPFLPMNWLQILLLCVCFLRVFFVFFLYRSKLPCCSLLLWTNQVMILKYIHILCKTISRGTTSFSWHKLATNSFCNHFRLLHQYHNMIWLCRHEFADSDRWL